jgi:hypothetical protein
VELRPVLPSDIGALRRIELSEHNLTRWRFAGEVPSPDEHRRALWSGVLEQRVVTTSTSPEPIGLVNAHRADLRSGTAWLGVVEDEACHGCGHGLAGLALFIDWLLDRWPLRQLHAEVDEANLGQFASVTDEFATVTGRLGARFHQCGRSRDAVLLSVDRDRWISTARARVRAELGSAPITSPISLDEVCEIAARHGGDFAALTPDTELADIGLDSLGVLLVLDEIEQRTGEPIGHGPQPVVTLADLVALVRGGSDLLTSGDGVPRTAQWRPPSPR